MKARPTLMNGRSVRNLLAGRKTQTRRIAKLNIAGRVERGGRQWHIDDPDAIKASPYVQPGDLLYVRETIEYLNVGWGHHVTAYSANKEPVHWQIELPTNRRVIPSIHMPRRASRLTLRLTGVRVERVQEITYPDIRAEGVETCSIHNVPHTNCRYLLDAFAELWNDTNGPDAWDRNDWVWVLSFDVIHANVDDVLADPEKYGIKEVA